jgi:hypothetical protein
MSEYPHKRFSFVISQANICGTVLIQEIFTTSKSFSWSFVTSISSYSNQSAEINSFAKTQYGQ